MENKRRAEKIDGRYFSGALDATKQKLTFNIYSELKYILLLQYYFLYRENFARKCSESERT